jgi:hypothetical protein
MDEDALKEFLKPKFQREIYPDSVIYLRGARDDLIRRIENFPYDQIKDTHWVGDRGYERMEEWFGNNSLSNFLSEDPTKYPLTRFFQENKTEIFEVDYYGNNFEMFESMRIYVERDGRPYNYLSSIDDLNKKREHHLHIEEKEWRQTN